MTAVIEIEFLQGNNEQVIKEAAICAEGARLHYLFRPPYHMEPHGSKESGLNWDDGFIHYSQVQTVLTEALAPTIICTREAMTNVSFSMVFSTAQYTIWKPSIAQNPRNLSQRFIVTSRATLLQICNALYEMLTRNILGFNFTYTLKLLSNAHLTIRDKLQSSRLVFQNLILSCDHLACFRGI